MAAVVETSYALEVLVGTWVVAAGQVHIGAVHLWVLRLLPAVGKAGTAPASACLTSRGRLGDTQFAVEELKALQQYVHVA